jgi:hypothetical protein
VRVVRLLFGRVFETSSLVSGSVEDKSGNFQEAKDKRFCVPEGLTTRLWNSP